MTSKRIKVLLRLAGILMVGIFLWKPQQTLFFVFDAVTQVVPRFQLSAIPAPPEVTDKESAVGSFLGEAQFIRYHTTLTKEDRFSYYEQVLPRQGWTVEISERKWFYCLRVERQRERLSILISEDRWGNATIQVMFTTVGLMC
jgi:hypothetical protein